MYESSTKETKWVCIQLACSRRPRALEEAHCWNIQAKFYNENFPLVYESDKTKDYHEDHGATLKHKCGKRIVALSLLFFYFFIWPFSFYGISIAIPRYIAMQLSIIPFIMTHWSLSYFLAWSCSWHSIFGKATIHNFHTCHSYIIAHPGTPLEAFT